MNYASLKDKFISSIMDNSSELFSVIDASGVYQFVGGSVINLLGYAPDEMVGNSAFKYIHPADQDLVGASLGSALFNRTTILPNFRIRHRNGTWRWMHCRITNLSDNPDVMGYITNSIDITEKIEGERDQMRTQAHYESLFYNHPDTVFELDRGGYFTLVNKNFQALTGYEAEKIRGVHFKNLVLEKDLPIAMNAFVNALEGNAHQIELSIVQSGGNVLNLCITVVPVINENEIVKIQCIARDVTIQNKYASYVKAQAEQLHNIMERVPESFFSLNREWHYTYVNKFYCTYLGLSKEELIGKNIWDVFPEAKGSTFYKKCMEVAETNLPCYAEEISPYNSNIVISVQVYPTGEDISVHFVDITEKKQEQDRLEKLSLVASKTNTCILIKNKYGQIEWANEAFEKVTGYSQSEIMLKEPLDFLTGKDSDLKTLSKLRKCIKKGKHFRGELLNYTKKGEPIWFFKEITPVHSPSGELIKFISIRTDITQRKLREQELLEVTRDLFKQNHDLQQFSYMVSHNLRAPAANIMGLSYLLSQLDKNSDTYDQAINKIQKSAHNLDTVIRDMNYILSIRNKDYELPLEEVNLAGLVQEALAALEYKLYRQPCNVHVAIAAELSIYTNKTYLLEIVKNLLSNAAKFSRKNDLLEIKLAAEKLNGGIELTITDNGIGIDMNQAKNDLFRIYKKFHVGYEGRGIGLFLVKTYLELLKGHIKVTSKAGVGTCFTIKLQNYS